MSRYLESWNRRILNKWSPFLGTKDVYVKNMFWVFPCLQHTPLLIRRVLMVWWGRLLSYFIWCHFFFVRKSIYMHRFFFCGNRCVTLQSWNVPCDKFWAIQHHCSHSRASWSVKETSNFKRMGVKLKDLEYLRKRGSQSKCVSSFDLRHKSEGKVALVRWMFMTIQNSWCDDVMHRQSTYGAKKIC